MHVTLRVVLQQVDLDTCLTGLLLGVGSGDELTVSREGATPEELADAAVLCIEAGGSGETDRNNFDHHDVACDWPSACVQALKAVGTPVSPKVERLVSYVADVDLARGAHVRRRADATLGLSSIFSGMRLTVRDPGKQFLEGMGLLQVVLDESIDPSGPMPARPEWQPYAEARRREREVLDAVLISMERFCTRQGRRAGLVCTDRVGALGALYETGCEIAIAYAPAFRPPAGGAPIRKFTVGARDGLRVDRLLGPLAAREPGWGGPAHGTIIASPRAGTELETCDVKQLVSEHL